tara:strand:+ start:1102 stop:2262 length:1161 start_codon:yes stop_codon:yes gene_type:complete
MKKQKICVITGTRAEYGLLRPVIDGIQKSKYFELQIIATGMHLSQEFGLTFKEIEKDGNSIDKKLDMLVSSDTAQAIIKSMGLGMIGFSDAYEYLEPDLILILGDRFEIYSAASAAMISRIPIAHLHGGESTEGLIDEPIRHCITKMSQIHFVAAEEYRKRVIQLGEDPKRVHLVGGLGVDSIKSVKLLSKKKLEQKLNFKFGLKNLLITFHPVTLEKETSKKQMKDLLIALDHLENTKLIFTMPNADTEGRILFKLIEQYVRNNDKAKAFVSLGYQKYLSCIKYVDGVIGNSSSGLLEVPSFKKGTIDIGDRQRGRLKAESVISCKPTSKSINNAIKKLYSMKFQKTLQSVKSPYGSGGASKKIVKILEKTSLDNILKKKFYNLR